MSERYHLGGRVETDTVAMAAARQDQAGIQRRHRLEHRQGDDPSQTPPFTSLVARHEVSQDTEEPQLQLLINPALPNQPRHGRGHSSLPRPSLTHDPIVLPSLGVDVDVPVCPMIPSILPRLGLDVLVYLMHHRIALPQVTLCPWHTGLGSKVSGRLYTTNISLNAMKNGLTYS
jgi:hypothetical protein